MEWIEIASAVMSCDQGLGFEILHRKTKGIKFHGNLVVSCKAANRNKVFD